MSLKATMPPEQWLEFCAGRTTPDLFESLRRLDRFESWSLAAILAHLAELDRRRAAEERGFPSLFAYCTRELGCSEAEAYLRIRAARAAIRFPRILTMIAERSIHLTAVARLAPHLTSENYRSVLDKASRRPLDELDRLIATLAPLPEKRPVIRTLSVGLQPAGPAEEAGCLALPLAGMGTAAGARPQAAAGAPQASGQSGPVSAGTRTQADEPIEGRVLFHFVASESLRAKFNRARDLLRHKYPHGRPENVFDDALEALLDRKDLDRRIARKRRRALAEESRALAAERSTLTAATRATESR
ncbi:MAG: hypothetical protein HY748_16235 [Elusimicrobia bacterium]|nr:hypothetical protein [Elusimicrobiota bacterium]